MSGATAIHAMHAWRGEFVAAYRAMAAEQFAQGQAVEERRVLLVAMNVVHLEMCPDGQRIHREHFGAALDFGKARFSGHRKGNVERFSSSLWLFENCYGHIRPCAGV